MINILCNVVFCGFKYGNTMSNEWLSLL